MTQPVVNAEEANGTVPSPPAAVQVPPVPVLTYVLEHTEQTLRVTDENGQKSVTVERKAVTWKLGESVPGDSTTTIVAMFRDDAGGVRIWVQPRPGSPGAIAGLAHLIELPASAVRFTMKTFSVANLQSEILADEQTFLLGDDEEEEEAAPPTVGQG